MMTVHLKTNEKNKKILQKATEVSEMFGIYHSTIQIEDEETVCC